MAALERVMQTSSFGEQSERASNILEPWYTERMQWVELVRALEVQVEHALILLLVLDRADGSALLGAIADLHALAERQQQLAAELRGEQTPVEVEPETSDQDTVLPPRDYADARGQLQ